MSVPQVLIVGAGVTGSLLACMVREMGLAVRVLEKSRGPGGRMATHRFREGDRSSPVVARADLGAQYISTKSEAGHAVLGPIYKRLIDAGVLVPFAGKVSGPNPYGGNDDVRHYAAPQGLSSLAEFFIKSADIPVDYGTGVEEITVSQDGQVLVKVTEGDDIIVSNQSVLVLTQPVPQILGSSKFPVKGNFLDMASGDITDALKKVEYSSRFAAAYAFPNLTWPFEWTVQYFGSGDVRYLANDSSRRSANNESSASIVVHSAVPLGIELVDEEDPFPTASARLQVDLEKKLPEIPWREASHVKIHKWKYSQVYKGYGASRPAPDWTWTSDEKSCNNPAFPGCVSVFQTDQALGLLAGDAFAPASKFDGCAYSAHKSAEAISGFIKSRLAAQ